MVQFLSMPKSDNTVISSFISAQILMKSASVILILLIDFIVLPVHAASDNHPSNVKSHMSSDAFSLFSADSSPRDLSGLSADPFPLSEREYYDALCL
jgi:hypothetical protein